MRDGKRANLGYVLEVLRRLQEARIHYRLEHARDALMIIATVPGERWEIELFVDGSVEVERFVSTGAIEGEESLEMLISRYSS